MRSESHQAPARGCSTSSGAFQLWRSGERDRKISPCPSPNAVVGRWNSTHWPFTRSGRSAAFLSSGRLTMPMALDRAEVLRGREIDGGAARAVRGARDHPRLELRHPDDARILEAPLLALDSRLRSQERLAVDLPAVDAVRRAGHGQMRDTRQPLDPRQQHRLAVDDGGARVEHDVHRIGPVRRLEDRIRCASLEELAPDSRHTAAFARAVRRRSTTGSPAASSSSSAR